MNHIGTREIATERLTLRRFEIEDAENMFYNWANDPEVTKYLTWPAHESVDTTETILKEWISKYDEKDFYQWAIELNDLEQPIGTISAIKTDERVESVEIGYCIGKRFWNNGYMTEALTAIIRFFINEVGAGRVWARHDTENPNSGKVMAAAGMDYEGTLRHAGFNNQGICDEAVYAKVRSAVLDEEPEEETPEQQAVTTKVMGEDGVMRNVISDETMEYVGILAKLELSPEEAEAAKKDMADMNVKPATTAPQATQEIQGMIDMIQTLIDKGYAYPAADGTVYFRVKKFKEYGKLSHKNLDDLQSGFRSLKVSGEDQKEDPLDFVLWKPKKEGEPSWPSPWCDGRPGWHIECSVMSKKYLGEEIDIHAGGEDLIFPHHENEIAQSECCNGKIFARYWMHNGFLNIDNRKMSKSLGNFRTVRQIGEQYDLQVLRFFMLNAHYRSPLNFSADLMEAAKNSLERILEAAGKLSDRKDNGAAENITEEELALLKEAEGFVTKFEAAMDDDFNTADALAAIFELVKFANTNVDENSSREFAGGLYEELFKLSDVLGLKIEKKEEILDKEIEDLIQERQAARKAKDFKRADEIRDELLKKGIILKDTREGVKWQRA